MMHEERNTKLVFATLEEWMAQTPSPTATIRQGRRPMPWAMAIEFARELWLCDDVDGALMVLNSEGIPPFVASGGDA